MKVLIFSPLVAVWRPRLPTLLRRDLAPQDRFPCLSLGDYPMTSGFRQPRYQEDLGQGRRGYTFRGDPIRVGGPCRSRCFRSRERQRLKRRKII